MDERRGRGRPPIRPEGTGTDRIYLRSSEDEHALFTVAAERAGVSLSAWLRAAALEKLEREATE